MAKVNMDISDMLAAIDYEDEVLLRHKAREFGRTLAHVADSLLDYVNACDNLERTIGNE